MFQASGCLIPSTSASLSLCFPVQQCLAACIFPEGHKTLCLQPSHQLFLFTKCAFSTLLFHYWSGETSSALTEELLPGDIPSCPRGTTLAIALFLVLMFFNDWPLKVRLSLHQDCESLESRDNIILITVSQDLSQSLAQDRDQAMRVELNWLEY